jgi:hypothetical protein
MATKPSALARIALSISRSRPQLAIESAAAADTYSSQNGRLSMSALDTAR